METAGGNGRKNATIPELGILADFQPAELEVVQQPRPPTQSALRPARVSDLGFAVSALQAGELSVCRFANAEIGK